MNVSTLLPLIRCYYPAESYTVARVSRNHAGTDCTLPGLVVFTITENHTNHTGSQASASNLCVSPTPHPLASVSKDLRGLQAKLLDFATALC